MVLEILSDGMLNSNCFIFGDSQEGVIIDPGAPAHEIMELVEKHRLNIKYIILTHGHIDHICTVEEIRKSTGAKVAIHREDASALTDSGVNLSLFIGEPRAFNAADIFLSGNETLKVGTIEIDIIHTPGHTPGGICIKADKIVFTGDTLFEMSIGRTDFPGGNPETLLNAIKNKLMILEEDVRVYPGHGSQTSIGREKKMNMFLRGT